MKRLIALFALLLACGSVEAQDFDPFPAPVGGAGTGAAADPTPVFEFAPGIDDNGPAAIPVIVPTFTTMEASIDCDFRDHTTSLACDTGGTWTEVTGYGGGGGDVKPGYRAPWIDDASSASNFYRAVVRAPATTTGEIATEDFIAIVEADVSAAGAAQTIFGKFDSATPAGWSINVTSGNVVRATVNGTSTTGYTLPRAQHNVYAVACKHDGSANSLRFYVNYKMVASATCPAATSAAATKNAEIGGRSNSGADQIDGWVSFAKLWKCPAGTPQCMTGTTATMDAVVLEMMGRAFGVWPTEYVTAAPITLTRASSASLQIVEATETAQYPRIMWFDVGSHWPRVGRGVDDVGTDKLPRIAGYYPEPGQANLALRSRQFGTTWTKLTAGDTTQEDPFSSDTTRTPADSLEADRYLAAADAVGVEHGWRQGITLEAGKAYNFSVFSAYGTGQRSIMWMRDNTVADAIAWFDVSKCKVLSVGTGLHDPGATNSRLTASAFATHQGTIAGSFTWCRTMIKVDGTAASHDFDIGWSAADGATTSTTSASETLGVLWHAQVEAIENILIEGERESSPIVTTTASATRARDALQFSHDNTPPTGMIECSFLLPANNMDNSTGGASSGLALLLEVDSDNYVTPEQTGEFQLPGWGFVYDITTGGVAQFATEFSSRGHSLRDGQLHRFRATYLTNDARLYIDGDTTADLTDTNVTIPTFSSGGISIGYSETFDTEWTRGWIERCRLYSAETIPTYP